MRNAGGYYLLQQNDLVDVAEEWRYRWSTICGIFGGNVDKAVIHYLLLNVLQYITSGKK